MAYTIDWQAGTDDHCIEVEAFGMWVCAASAGTFCDETVGPDVLKVYLGENR